MEIEFQRTTIAVGTRYFWRIVDSLGRVVAQSKLYLTPSELHAEFRKALPAMGGSPALVRDLAGKPLLIELGEDKTA